MTSNTEGFWTEPRFKMIAFAGGVALFALLLLLTFDYELTVPAKPPKPEHTLASATQFSKQFDQKTQSWEKYLAKDAQLYGMRSVDPDALRAVFRYRVDDESRFLVPGDDDTASVEAAGLRLTVGVKAGGVRDTMILRIENTTDAPLAYRVQTRPSKGTRACQRKPDLEHNALVVWPGEVQVRSECIYRDGWKLKVNKVETLELPELSAYYVSRVAPPAVGYEPRVARGHKAPRGADCSPIFPAPVANGLQSGQIAWRDVIDFYARHRCETYTFPSSYTHFGEPAERPLPADGARR